MGDITVKEIQYYKKVYSKFWEKQTKKYGYGAYEQNLARLVLKSKPKKVFEVGIGTGWPIGAALKEKGVMVDGCDIAPSSVELARKELGNEKGIWAGAVTRYKGESGIYDVVYCVRASWYIPDFYKTLNKMLYMTKPGGGIVFDVMDMNSICCIKVRVQCMWNRVKKICCGLLGIDIDDLYGVHFMSIRRMKKFLSENGLTYRCWGEREITGSKDICHTPKVVFYCRKEP